MHIYIDRPRMIVFRGRHRRACHASGPDIERVHTFMEAIGVPRRAFHNKPNRPHYDLFDEYITAALLAGAVQVGNKDFIQMLVNAYEK